MWLLSLLLLVGLCSAQVEKLIEQEVYRRFGDKVRVNKIRLPADFGNSKFDRIELDMEYGKSRAIASLFVGEKRYLATLDVLWKVNVYIALEDIPKGTPIRRELFKEEERLVKSLTSDINLSPEDFENYVASTSIIKGTMLRRSLMKEIPAVRAGEAVEVFFRGANLELSFQAVAVDSGQVGKVIRVKRENRVLRGRVVSRGKVEVLP